MTCRFILKWLDYSLSISMRDSLLGLRPRLLPRDRNLEFIMLLLSREQLGHPCSNVCAVYWKYYRKQWKKTVSLSFYIGFCESNDCNIMANCSRVKRRFLIGSWAVQIFQYRLPRTFVEIVRVKPRPSSCNIWYNMWDVTFVWRYLFGFRFR